MSTNTTIEWTERTWNPLRGCSVVSPGCANCYAMRQAHRFSGAGRAYDGLTKATKAGPQWAGRVDLVESALTEPLGWRRPSLVFVNSMSDLFHDAVPDAWIDRIFAVMSLAPQHTFQVLTKRAARMRDYMQSAGERVLTAAYKLTDDLTPDQCRRYNDAVLKGHQPWVPGNVWLGVSAEDQQRADERIPHLLRTPAAVRFVSAEPLIGPIDLMRWIPHAARYQIHQPSPSGKQQWQCLECGRVTAGVERDCRTLEMGQGLSWIIVGGESGPGARPCAETWVRSIVEQCAAADTACFVKQLGSRPVRRVVYGPHDFSGAQPVHDEPWPLINRKGSDPSEWPPDLRVRQFPNIEVPA